MQFLNKTTVFLQKLCQQKSVGLILILACFGLLAATVTTYALWNYYNHESEYDPSKWKVMIWNDELPTVSVETKIPIQYKRNISFQSLSTKYTLTAKKLLIIERATKRFITFFVKSAPTHVHRRNVIRNTWGSFTKIGPHFITVVFLIGASGSESVDEAVAIESECFQDILRTDHLDEFNNLTVKTLSAFLWIKNNLKDKSMFYIFTDDDCVIDVYSTISFLQGKSTKKQPRNNRMYCGFQYEQKAGVIRGDSKLSVSYEHYPLSHYPSFCRGVMVILSYELIRDIYDVSTVTDYAGFPLEDVLVYGILRAKLDIATDHILPVINGGKSLVFYPWDDTATAVHKMKRKWLRIETPFHWKQKLVKNIVHTETCSKFSQPPNEDTIVE